MARQLKVGVLHGTEAGQGDSPGHSLLTSLTGINIVKEEYRTARSGDAGELERGNCFMKRFVVWLMVLFLMLDEAAMAATTVRINVQELQQQASQLDALGKKEEAAALRKMIAEYEAIDKAAMEMIQPTVSDKSGDSTVKVSLEELRQRESELRAQGKMEEAARLKEKIDALEKAEKKTANFAARTNPEKTGQILHVKAAKTTRKATAGEAFLIVVDGKSVKSYTSGNKSIATVNKAGLVKTKKRGTAKITVTLKNNKKYTVTLKVRQDLAGLIGKKFTAALAAAGGKTSQVFKDGKSGDDFSVYTKQGIALIGLDHKRYRKNKMYKKTWRIELRKKSDFSICGVSVGDTVTSAKKNLKAAGCKDIEAGKWTIPSTHEGYIDAKTRNGDRIYGEYDKGKVVSLTLDRRY